MTNYYLVYSIVIIYSHLALMLHGTALLAEQVKLGLDGQLTPTDPVQAFLLQLLNLGPILRNADCSQLLVPTFML